MVGSLKTDLTFRPNLRAQQRVNRSTTVLMYYQQPTGQSRDIRILRWHPRRVEATITTWTLTIQISRTETTIGRPARQSPEQFN